MLSLSDFKYVEGGCHLPSGNFMRNRMMTADMIGDFKKEFRNTGIYLSAYWYNNEDVKEADLYGHFYLDFDNEQNFELARRDAINAVHFLCTYHGGCKIPQRFIRVFFSGKKGLHIVVPATVFGVEPCKELNQYYRVMAEQVLSIVCEREDQENYKTTDLKIYDRRRLFRVANSIHQSTGLHKVPLTIEELKTATYEEIIEKAKHPVTPTWEQAHEISRAMAFYNQAIEAWKNRFEKRFGKDRQERVLDFDPPCVQELLTNGPQKGQRNNTAAALVSHFKSRGASEQEAWDKIVEWNDGSMEERELKTVMRSVYNGGYRYGCSTLEVLATCSDECPIKKARGNKY